MTEAPLTPAVPDAILRISADNLRFAAALVEIYPGLATAVPGRRRGALVEIALSDEDLEDLTYLCGEVLPSPLARLVATRPPGAPPSAALQAFAERMEEMYRLGE